jgi:hypothetical protein
MDVRSHETKQSLLITEASNMSLLLELIASLLEG